MYQVGELIVYGGEGVCRVEEIGVPKISGIDRHRKYYTLAPLYRGGKIYTPVDTKVFMRPVITQEGAMALIRRIPKMQGEVHESSNIRYLSDYYQSCMQNYTCADLVQMVKDINAKQDVLHARGKKMGLVDERYLKRAEEMLHGELAAALEIDRGDVPAFLSRTLRREQETRQLA